MDLESRRKGRLRDGERRLHNLYDEFRTSDKDPDTPDTITTTATESTNRAFDIHSWRYGDMNTKKNSELKNSELERYFTAPILQLGSQEENDAFDPIKWWKEHEKEYPTLACIAYDLFAIPCSSAEPERVFSGYLVIFDFKINCRCGLTITDLRSRLLPDVVEAVECLRWWMKRGFLDDGYHWRMKMRMTIRVKKETIMM